MDTPTITRAECDHCGKQVRILRDGTVGKHSYMSFGNKVECSDSGKRYAFHLGTFRVIERDANRHATLWLCECRCGETKPGPDYAAVEQWHTEHFKAAS